RPSPAERRSGHAHREEGIGERPHADLAEARDRISRRTRARLKKCTGQSRTASAYRTRRTAVHGFQSCGKVAIAFWRVMLAIFWSSGPGSRKLSHTPTARVQA